MVKYLSERVRLCLALLLWIWALPSSAQIPSRTTAPDPVEQARQAVVRIVAGEGVGTGFLVRSDGVLVTAYHVIAGAETAWAYFPGGKVCPVEGVLACDPGKDLALLKVRADQLPEQIKAIELASARTHKRGDQIATIGHPGGGPLTTSRGTLLGIEKTPGSVNKLEVDAHIVPGCSGSPILNMAGEAIGVAVSCLMDTDDFGLAVSVEALGPLPPAGGPLRTLAETAKAHEGSAEQLFAQATSVMDFWRDRGKKGAEARPAIEWALGKFVQAAVKRPDFVEAHFNVGTCRILLGRLSEGITALKEVVRLCPDDVAGHYLLSAAYAASGRKVEGEAQIREAIRACPGFAPAHRLLGAYCADKRQYEAAVTELQTAVRLKPRDSMSTLDLGMVYFHMKRWKDAISELRRALALKPGIARAHYYMGLCYGVQGLHRESAEEHEQAILIQADYPEAHYSLAVEYLAIGNKGQARREYETLRKLDPNLASKLKRLLSNG